MCGLPSDQFTYEGATIVHENYCWTFLIDPEDQAVKWIKNIFVEKKLRSVDYQDLKWISIVELAITNGFPVLIENVSSELKPDLRSLLKTEKNQKTIQFNDKNLKLNSSFHLYLSTKLPDPDFSSFPLRETSIVNFMIKQKGLEDQLLLLLVRNERPDLEIIKEKLVKKILDCKKQFSELEDKILMILSSTHGSLLDDEVLVEVLQDTKSLSIAVETELSNCEKTETRIDASRNGYRPCAKLASVLYFVLTDMAHVSPIYVFALEFYIDLFLNSIQKAAKDADVSNRVKKINSFHQFSVYRYACRSILKKHALLFVFHMYTQTLIEDNKLTKKLYDFFIYGGQITDQTTHLINLCPQWLSQDSWNHIIQIELLPKFFGITVSFDESSKLWYEWYISLEPENKVIPAHWKSVCTEFEKLLLIRCLRPDRIRNCITNLISSNLGQNFLIYPDLDVKEVFNDSTANKPFVLFTLSTDINPEKILLKLANEFNVKCRLFSLGVGKGKAASQLIVDSIKMGDWCFISNCHLLQSWFPTLEKIVLKLQTVKAHKNFRLLLSLSPTKAFPTSVLQSSIIVSMDSPKGIKANMIDLYNKFSSETVEFSSYEPEFKRLIYSLSFFHSILVGRKRFQNLGWNSDYQFSYSDFKVSYKMLQFYLNEYKEDPWSALKQMIAKVTYGGHLRDKRDEELMIDYYDQCICDEASVNSKFHLSSVGNYIIPECEELDAFINSIKSLPNYDVPEVFGQHNNAEIPCQMYDADKLLKNLSKINKRDVMLESLEITNLILNLKNQTPDLIDTEAAIRSLDNEVDPYSYILMQEIQQYNALLTTVSELLQDIENALLGKQTMTAMLSKQISLFQKKEVPSEWKKFYPSSKPLGSWFEDLQQRVKFFSCWISAGTIPIKIWLSAFTNPISFLNAVLLTVARQSDVSLKDLKWEYHVSTLDEKYINELPSEGIYIRGLFLEGAGWDRTNGMLTEPEPLRSITPMPVILFKPVTESSIRGVFNCPCYYTMNRTDEEGNTSELFCVDLRTKERKEYWRKHSTCLLLSDNS